MNMKLYIDTYNNSASQLSFIKTIHRHNTFVSVDISTESAVCTRKHK